MTTELGQGGVDEVDTHYNTVLYNNIMDRVYLWVTGGGEKWLTKDTKT